MPSRARSADAWPVLVPFQLVGSKIGQERCEPVAQEAFALAGFQETFPAEGIVDTQTCFVVYECHRPPVSGRTHLPIGMQFDPRLKNRVLCPCRAADPDRFA